MGLDCFPVEGLSLIDKTYIYARISHLSQSSGYGKTRLCFETLRNFRRGIYCVYRPPTEADSGFPSTCPWMTNLIIAFADSKSDEQSEQICLNFIGWAVDTFSSLNNTHFSYFDGSGQIPAEINFNNQPKTAASIIAKVGDRLFTVVIDECQEFVITPSLQQNLISLYRAFRRAMNKIVEAPVVVVFLGTKSSLEDFVLAGANRSSVRELLANIERVFEVPVYVLTHSCNSTLNTPYNLTLKTTCMTKLVNGVEIPQSKTLQSIAWDCGRPLWRQYKSFGQALKVAI